jgi:bifunctional non-homologous end joining protein LigD
MRLLQKVTQAGVQLNGHIDGGGQTIFRRACKLALDGIISKHPGHPYRSGPSKSWIRVKIRTCRREEEA